MITGRFITGSLWQSAEELRKATLLAGRRTGIGEASRTLRAMVHSRYADLAQRTKECGHFRDVAGRTVNTLQMQIPTQIMHVLAELTLDRGVLSVGPDDPAVQQPALLKGAVAPLVILSASPLS